MRLQISTWPEIEQYLSKSTGVIVPIGSTEQHGPTGLIGTDAITAEEIAWEAGKRGDILVAPTFNVGSAQHHMGFPGTMTLRPSTMIAAITDWVLSLAHHGFTRIYFINGHGGNVAPIAAAFADIYARRALDGSQDRFRMMQRNWYELPNVEKLDSELYPVGGGSHATAGEISVTFAVHPEKEDTRELDPKIAPTGVITDKHHYREQFADGRIGSDPSQSRAEHGRRLIDAATDDLVKEAKAFFSG